MPATINVFARLADIDLAACQEFLRDQDLAVRDIQRKENEDGCIEWIFAAPIATVDKLR